MNQQLPSDGKNKLEENSLHRSSLQINNRRDLTTSSSRTLSPVAFFHDSFLLNETDLYKNFMGAQRRAQAIATAPRRKRYDDENDEEEPEKTLLGYIKTSSLPIPIHNESQHSYSAPQIQSGTNLLPTFRIDPPSQDQCESVDCTLNHHICLTRYPSAP